MAKLSDEQSKVAGWLSDDLELPVFANAYRGAIHFMQEKPPGFVTFVSHAGRDIMNLLANEFLDVKAGRVEYVKLVEVVAVSWNDGWRIVETTSLGLVANENSAIRSISETACVHIQKLVDEHRLGRTRNEESNFAFFRAFLDYKHLNTVPKEIFEKWERARRWFLKHTHLRRPSFDAATEAELVDHFATLEKSLLAAANSMTDSLRGLNEILEETNS